MRFHNAKQTMGRGFFSKAHCETNKETSKSIIPSGEKTNMCPLDIPAVCIRELNCISMGKPPPCYRSHKTFASSMTKDKSSSLIDTVFWKRGINSLLILFLSVIDPWRLIQKSHRTHIWKGIINEIFQLGYFPHFTDSSCLRAPTLRKNSCLLLSLLMV